MNKDQSSRFLKLLLTVCLGNPLGCSTTEVGPPAPAPPVYTQVPHPVGMDLGDLEILFQDPHAPKNLDFVNTCDKDYQKLKELARSKDDFEKGTTELVRRDPVAMHWCFYGKLNGLSQDLKKDLYIDEKQKVVLETFSFLTPIAKVYAREFHDSRYLRWAVSRYQKISEWLFFRKLELTPAGTSQLVQAENPFGLWRNGSNEVSVLEKYHLNQSLGDIPVTAPIPEGSPSPVSSPSPVVSVFPVSSPSPEGSPFPTPQVSVSPQGNFTSEVVPSP